MNFYHVRGVGDASTVLSQIPAGVMTGTPAMSTLNLNQPITAAFLQQYNATLPNNNIVTTDPSQACAMSTYQSLPACVSQANAVALSLQGSKVAMYGIAAAIAVFAPGAWKLLAAPVAFWADLQGVRFSL